MREELLDYVWESNALSARAARLMLAPAGSVFAFAVAVRNAAYDNGWLPSYELALPTVCIGNLSVGGTGKTPFAAWVVRQLGCKGARPAVVLRGYGSDEILVHQCLNPDVPVVADVDRGRGVLRAKAAGASVAVLDDGFQHRRARRMADIVLLSADRFGPWRPLPAGPWREPLSSLARAQAVVVTRKTVPAAEARRVLDCALRSAPQAVGAIAELAPDALVSALGGEGAPLSALADTEALAISAIGDHRAFESQLRAQGARLTSAASPDHYQFSAEDAASLAGRIRPGMWAVCTLKDAVKLAPHWPRKASPLWYLSQRISIEHGGDALEDLLARLVTTPALPTRTTPAPAGPTIEPNVP